MLAEKIYHVLRLEHKEVQALTSVLFIMLTYFTLLDSLELELRLEDRTTLSLIISITDNELFLSSMNYCVFWVMFISILMTLEVLGV